MIVQGRRDQMTIFDFDAIHFVQKFIIQNTDTKIYIAKFR